MAGLVPLRTDQAAATQAKSFQSVVETGRAFYWALMRHKSLMRGGFDDTDTQNINWDQLKTMWGGPVDDIDGDSSGKFLWDRVNGTLMLLDDNEGNNDFQKLINLVV